MRGQILVRGKYSFVWAPLLSLLSPLRHLLIHSEGEWRLSRKRWPGGYRSPDGLGGQGLEFVDASTVRTWGAQCHRKEEIIEESAQNCMCDFALMQLKYS